jgi:hypothetical protein
MPPESLNGRAVNEVRGLCALSQQSERFTDARALATLRIDAASSFAIVDECGLVPWFTNALKTERLTRASRAIREMPAARIRARRASYVLRASR